MSLEEVLVRELAPLLEQERGRRYGVGYKHDATGIPNAQYAHGPGGLLTYPGVDPLIFHTVVGNKGIIGQLPTKPSLYMNPTYFTITGVQGDTGSEKGEVCANAPYAGLKKGCLTTSVFGRYERATREIELNRLGQLVDRADPMDIRLIGSPIHEAHIFAGGPESPGVPGDLLTNEIRQKFWERNVSIHRLLSRQLWAGTPANNSAGGGYKELTGFELLVNTGYVDAETGNACAALDSDLKNFNYGRIDNAVNADLLVNFISEMYKYLHSLAERTSLLPVRWVIVMREDLFEEITEIWPCSYLTYRCQTTAANNEQLVVMATEQVKMRDEMRAGKYLLIRGERIEVVMDDGITEWTGRTNWHVTPGCFSSDIFFIPMSVVGGQSVTFLEYFDYTNPSIGDALANMVLGRVEGPFITWPRQTNQCVVWQTKIEPRLVLRTPWLAGRIQNVQYCPLQHIREPFPSDPYFIDGGRVSRPGPSLFSLWRGRQ